MAEYKTIDRELLRPPPDPLRVTMNEAALEDLAASIKLLGILEPLLVAPAPYVSPYTESGPEPLINQGLGAARGHYEIIDGHRRYLAAGMVGVTELPCMVFPDAEEAKWAMMLHANVCREDVTPAEEGWQFLTLAEKKGWSMPDLMRFFRRSENYINDRVDLVRGDECVVMAVAAREIGFTVAKEILRVKEPGRRTYLLDQAVVHGATARTIKTMIESYKAQDNVAVGLPAPHTPTEHIGAVDRESPKCLWCQEETEPEHMREVKVHWYHLRDLTKLLEELGLRRGAPAQPVYPAPDTASRTSSGLRGDGK